MVTKFGQQLKKKRETWGLSKTGHGGKHMDLSLMKQREIEEA